MEWCGWDWPCIWSNVFGAAAAAWVQAGATVAVFVWSIKSSRKTFEEDQKRTRESYERQLERDRIERAARDERESQAVNYERLKNLARAVFIVNKSIITIGALKNILDEAAKTLDLDTVRVAALVRSVHQEADFVIKLMMREFPNPSVLGQLQRIAVVLDAAAMFGSAGAERLRYAASKKKLEDSISYLKKVQKNLIDYQEEFTKNPNATLDPVEGSDFI